MSRRFKSRTMRFGVPLATAESNRVFHCYASHGKAYAHTPPCGAEILMLLIDASRATRWAPGRYIEGYRYACDDAQREDWKRLGWIMTDGMMPLGEYDAVDPDLAQFDYLPVPDNSEGTSWRQWM